MEKVQGWVEQGNTTLSIGGATGVIARKVQGSYPGATVTVYINSAPGVAISAISRTSNVVTVTVASGSGFIAGQLVAILGVTDASFDGTFTIISTSATQFTYAQTAANASSSGGYATSSLRYAQIYSDNNTSPTAKANPFVSASDGTWSFYASNGRYDVKFSGGSIAAPFTLSDFLLFDEQQLWIDASDTKYGPAGSEIGARINAALADLPATGGVINCWGLQGSQSMTTTVLVTKPAKILLGATTITFGGTGQGFRFQSAGSSMTGLSRTSTIFIVPMIAVDATLIEADDVVFSDFTLRGPNLASSGYTGIDSGGRANAIIERVTVEYFGSHGINTGVASSYWTLRDVICQFNWDDGLLLGAQTHHCAAYDCHFDDNGANGWDSNGDYNSVIGGSTNRNGSRSLTGVDAAGALIQALSAVSSGGYPTNANYNRLIGLEANANIAQGILVRGDPGYSANYNEILGCVANLNTGAFSNGMGINIDNSTTVTSNQIGNRIIGCVANGNQTYGILEGGGASTLEDNQIINNTAIGNSTANVLAVGTRPTVIGNKTTLADGLYRMVTAVDMAAAVTMGSTLDVASTLTAATQLRFGTLQFTATTATLSNGTNNDIAATQKSWLRITGPTGAFSITGFAGGQNGQMLLVYNTTSQQMTIVNNASSSAGNRISTLTGADVVLRAGTSFAIFVADSAGTGWDLVAYN